MATESTDRLLQQLVSESRDRFEMLDLLRRITLDVTNVLMLDVRIDDGQSSGTVTVVSRTIFIIAHNRGVMTLVELLVWRRRCAG